MLSTLVRLCLVAKPWMTDRQAFTTEYSSRTEGLEVHTSTLPVPWAMLVYFLHLYILTYAGGNICIYASKSPAGSNAPTLRTT